MKSPLGIAAISLAAIAAGCFYPPTTQPPPDERQQAVIPLPYDLAWDAVNRVIAQNQLRVDVQDPNEGVIEASGSRFTLHDADCGKISSIEGSYLAEPETDSTSVYNFLVRPRGPEATLVEVRATFNSAVKVPLHPTQDVDCVSHGIQESNILRQVLVAAKTTHRPEVHIAAAAPRPSPTPEPSSLKSSIERPGSEPTPSTTSPFGPHPPTLMRPHLPPPPKF